MGAMNKQREKLLDKPSIDSKVCAVCGRPAANRHHVIQKGLGGTKLEPRIPTIPLCGFGNNEYDGCHGLAHANRIEFKYDERDRLWKWRQTRHGGRWTVCFGQQEWTTYGKGR